MPKLLLVEDDKMLSGAVVQLLHEEHFEVVHVADADEGLDAAIGETFDLLIIDVMLPGMDGFSLVKKLRTQKLTVPILFLTARDHVSDRVRGLDVGADDYLVKPFASTELLARIRALLRRQGPEFSEWDTVAAGKVSLQTVSRELRIDDQVTTITPKEASLLELFLRHPGQVLTRSQLMARVWGFDEDVLENTLETYISKLRKRLEHDGCPTIQTVRGLGYRLQMKG